MTFYMLLSKLQNSKYGVTLRIKKNEKKNNKNKNTNYLNSQARSEAVNIWPICLRLSLT